MAVGLYFCARCSMTLIFAFERPSTLRYDTGRYITIDFRKNSQNYTKGLSFVTNYNFLKYSPKIFQ